MVILVSLNTFHHALCKMYEDQKACLPSSSEMMIFLCPWMQEWMHRTPELHQQSWIIPEVRIMEDNWCGNLPTNRLCIESPELWMHIWWMWKEKSDFSYVERKRIKEDEPSSKCPLKRASLKTIQLNQTFLPALWLCFQEESIFPLKFISFSLWTDWCERMKSLFPHEESSGSFHAFQKASWFSSWVLWFLVVLWVPYDLIKKLFSFLEVSFEPWFNLFFWNESWLWIDWDLSINHDPLTNVDHVYLEHFTI